jgi:MtN3 and saliva related transmembrane protein
MDYRYFGIAGMLLLQGSYTPQIIKTYTTKDVSSLSFMFILMVFLGCVCYLIYSISIRNKIYIIANSISITFTALLLLMIGVYG